MSRKQKKDPAQAGKADAEISSQRNSVFKPTISLNVNIIGQSNNADLYMYAGPLERRHEDHILIRIQHKANKRENAILFLDTFGGHADAAYKIAKAFKRHYKSLTVMIFAHCKSAGTLLCLGADHLVMADLAELGPLDVQIPKEGEFSGRRSGLDIADTLNALTAESIKLMRQHFLDMRVGSGTQISTRDALDNATKLVCGLLAPVYAQINPLSVGESARSNSIAYHYGQRLSNGNTHPHALKKLISGYPSHGFVIDREEASELFTSVRAPTPMEEMLMVMLLQKHEQLASRQVPLILCLTDEYPYQPEKRESQNGPVEEHGNPTEPGLPGDEGEPKRDGDAPAESGNVGPDGDGSGDAQPAARNLPGSNADTPTVRPARKSRSRKPGVKPE